MLVLFLGAFRFFLNDASFSSTFNVSSLTHANSITWRAGCNKMRDFDVITAVVLSTAVFMATNFLSLTLDDASVDHPVWTSDAYLNFTLSFGADEQLLRNMQHAIRLPNGQVLHSIPQDMIEEVVDGFVVGDQSLLTWTATALPVLAVLIAAACVVTAWADNILPSKRPDPAGGERLHKVNVIVKWFGSLGAWFAVTTLWQDYLIYAWEFAIPDRSILVRFSDKDCLGMLADANWRNCRTLRCI